MFRVNLNQNYYSFCFQNKLFEPDTNSLKFYLACIGETQRLEALHLQSVIEVSLYISG